MPSAIDRLKALCGLGAAPQGLARQMTAMSGLPVVELPADDAARRALEDKLVPMLAAADFAALGAEYARLFESKAEFDSGRRQYGAVHAIMLAPLTAAADDPEHCEALLDTYADHWRDRQDDPVAAGLYAEALAHTGYAFRGSDWADQVTESQWRMMADYVGKSARVLEGCALDARSHHLWLTSALGVAFARGAAGQSRAHAITDAFEAAIENDPYDIALYERRAVHLLPRWFGSYEAIEVFARQAMARTGARWGASMYARVYDTIVDFEPLHGTLVEYSLLRQGLQDWMELYPSQALANRFAAHAHAFNDMTTLEALFGEYLREIQPALWFAERQPLAAWNDVMVARRTARR
jgi:hypothetical protein